MAVDSSPASGSLLQHEAIELAYALAARAAEQAGVRVLAIKGLVGVAHGLRTVRTPADIDLLVDPAGFDDLTSQLEAWGWRSRLGEFTDVLIRHHSTTYLHDSWPCDIDVHHRFPGFLSPPEQTFDALWDRRVFLGVAGLRVAMADWASSVAVMALHSARSSVNDPRHTDELRTLLGLSLAWSERDRADLASLAVSTGCAHSLDAIWQQLGVTINCRAEDVSPDVLAEWRLQQDGRMPGARLWLRYIRNGGLRQAVTRSRTALWLPEPLIRASQQIPNRRLSLLRIRLSRLARILWRAPGNLFEIVRGGDNVTREALKTNRLYSPVKIKKPEKTS